LFPEELKSIGFASYGADVKISRNAKFYNPNYLHIGSNVRIDDFSIISVSASSSVGSWVHIGAHAFLSCSEGFEIGENSTLSPRVSVFGQSDDFTGLYLTHPDAAPEKRNLTTSRIIVKDSVVVGTGSILLPGAVLESGVAVGALSLIDSATEPWSIYVGIPAKLLKMRL
jgi:galactoside O-acetyltransferase